MRERGAYLECLCEGQIEVEKEREVFRNGRIVKRKMKKLEERNIVWGDTVKIVRRSRRRMKLEIVFDVESRIIE